MVYVIMSYICCDEYALHKIICFLKLYGEGQLYASTFSYMKSAQLWVMEPRFPNSKTFIYM